MGKRHRKGKGRYSKSQGLDDVLDEQMVEAVPDEKNNSGRSKNWKKGSNFQGKNLGKVDRNQRRNRHQQNNTKQRNLIQKGILFADQSDTDGIDLRKVLVS